MTYNAGVVCHFSPDTGHRRFILLTPIGVGSAYRVRQGTGAFIHLSTEQLRQFNLGEAEIMAVQNLDQIQHLGTIDLDWDDMQHLNCHRTWGSGGRQ